MKNLLIRIIIITIGFFCLCVFIIVRLEKTPSFITDKKLIIEEKSGIYGDLYYLCMVDNFKTILPHFSNFFSESERNSKINDADIIVFGDSFFAGSRVNKNFPEIIADSFKAKVFFSSNSYPLKILEKENYTKKKQPVVLLYEAVERRVLEDFKKRHDILTEKKQILSDILTVFLPYQMEMKYQFLLQKSLLTSKVYSGVMNLKYNNFELISDLTPIYKDNPPWLFYYQDVNVKNTSFYYQFSQEEIENVADNIFYLKKDLSELYNIELIFLLLPNKYTIYHDMLNDDKYNNLIPELYSSLGKRNVDVIKVFDNIKNSKDMLYYPTDTHWNEKGMNVVFAEVKKYLDNYYELKHF